METCYIYSRIVWRFYSILGILPWSQETGRRGQIRPTFWMLGYVLMLLIVFNIYFSFCFFYSDPQIASHKWLERIFMIIGQLRSCFLAVNYNIILLSTNIKTWRKKLDKIIHNLRDFDIRYKGELLTTETKLTMGWFKVTSFLTVIDLKRMGTHMHVNNVLSRLCIMCILELFSVITINIKYRYRKLNEKLIRHSYLKKPLVLRFSDQSFEYFHSKLAEVEISYCCTFTLFFN